MRSDVADVGWNPNQLFRGCRLLQGCGMRNDTELSLVADTPVEVGMTGDRPWISVMQTARGC